MRPSVIIVLLFCAGALRAEDAAPADAFQFFQEENQVVTATKFKTSLKETPASVTVITAEDIDRYGYRTVAEALRGVAGLYVDDDRSYSYLGVRGLNIPGDWSSRVLVMVDGVTMNDPLYGSGYTGRELGVDIGSVERIEVIMGPGSAIYGAHAMFAVVNVITRKGAQVRGGSVTGADGSGNSRELKAAAGAALGPHGDVYAQWSGLFADGQDLYLKAYDALTSGTDYENAYSGMAQLDLGGFSLTSNVSYRKKGIANPDGYSNVNDPMSNQVDQSDFIEAKYAQSQGSTLDWMVRAYHREYAYQGHYLVTYNSGGGPYPEENISEGDTKSLGGEMQLNWQAFQGDTLTLGAEGQNDYRLSQRTYDKGYTAPSLYYLYFQDLRSQTVASAYAQDIYKPIDGLSLILGARFDDYSAFGRTVNPRVGLLYTFAGRNTVKLLYGRAFNPPNAYQMYNNDGGATSIADPGLQPETLESYEAVLEHEFGPALASLSAYQNSMTNLIVDVTDPVTGVGQYVNQGDARSQGLELKLKGEWAAWRGRLGANYQRSVDPDSGAELVNSPRDTGNVGLSAPLFGVGFLSADLTYVGARGTVWGSWMSPYWLTDLTLYSADLVSHLQLTAKVSNLFDAYAASPSSGGTQLEFPLDGRTYYGKLSLVF